jgi:hypothetical protein
MKSVARFAKFISACCVDSAQCGGNRGAFDHPSNCARGLHSRKMVGGHLFNANVCHVQMRNARLREALAIDLALGAAHDFHSQLFIRASLF